MSKIPSLINAGNILIAKKSECAEMGISKNLIEKENKVMSI